VEWHPDYLIFNDSIIQSSEGSPRWATLRMANETAEARRSLRGQPVWVLDLSSLQLSGEQYEELLAFQYQVKGMLNPFLVRNVRNCRLENEAGDAAFLGVGDGSNTVFQLQKTRPIQGRADIETIRFPNWNYPPLETISGQEWEPMPELQIFVNGVAVSGWSVDRSTGLVAFSAPPAAGATISATGGFFTLMVANQDDIPAKPVGPIFQIARGVTFSEPVGGA
jgi:hypothetical protein